MICFDFQPFDAYFACVGANADFAATSQLQETGVGVLTPRAAMDALAGIMLAGQQSILGPSLVTAVNIAWSSVCTRVSKGNYMLSVLCNAKNLSALCTYLPESSDNFLMTIDAGWD